MKLAVLQAAAICFHGNSYLRGSQDAKPAELLLRNSTLRTAYELEFIRPSLRTGGSSNGSVALGTGRWYKRMRQESVGVFRLHLPVKLTETARAGTWGIMTDGRVGVEIWSPLRSSRASGSSDPTPWKFDYEASRSYRWSGEATQPAEEIEAELLPLIEQWRNFFKSERDEYLELIDRTLSCHRRQVPDALSFSDVVPFDMPKKERILACAAIRAIDLLERPGLVLPEDEELERLMNSIWKLSLKALEKSSSLEEAQQLAA